MDHTWRPDLRPQGVRVGKYFLLSDFLFSEDAIAKGIPNLPFYDSSEIAGMRGLCKHILDPVVEEFGPLSITFGYVSPALWRHWYGEKASLEGLHTYRPAQGGIGGAADILVHAHQDDPRTVLNWMRDRLTYDRLILYPGSPILCVAWTEREPRRLCQEWVIDPGDGKRSYVKAGRAGSASLPKRRGKRVEQGTLFFKQVLGILPHADLM